MLSASTAPLPRSSFNHAFNFMPQLLAMREANAIVNREFLLFAERYPIGPMKTIAEIRRENLLTLITIDFKDNLVCFTGEFLYGTRAACERLVLKVGAMCSDSVSRKIDILVIGTRVSPDWVHTSFGRKIQRAVELQDEGHAIEIISERKMMDVLQKFV
jgi:NAD-dependent DNA ligase